MNFTFTKEILNKRFFSNTRNEWINNYALYKILKDDILIGDLIYTDKYAYYSNKENEIKIDFVKHFFNATEYFIKDIKSEMLLGEFKIPSSGFAWNLSAEIYFKNKIYKCRKLKADIKYNIFKKDSWNNYKIEIYNIGNESENIIYTYHMDMPALTSNNKSQRSFIGAIQSTLNDLDIIFIGFLYIEYIFKLQEEST